MQYTNIALLLSTFAPLASATISSATVAFASTMSKYCAICDSDPSHPNYDPNCGLSPVNCTGADANTTYPLQASYTLTNHGGRTLTGPLVYLDFYSEKTYWTSSNVSIYIDAITNVGNSSYMSGFLSATGLTKPTYGTYEIHLKATNPPVSYQDDMLNMQRHQILIEHSFDAFSGTNDDTWPSFNANSAMLLILSPTQSLATNLMIDSNTPYDSKTNGFCGYHSFFTSDVAFGSHKTIYGVVGTGGVNCKWNSNNTTFVTPQSGFIDVTVSVMLHELFEMMSNPEFTAWYDNGPVNQLEWADKCQGYPSGVNFVSGTSGAVYNAIIGTKKYLLQAVFNKTSNTCSPLIYT